MPSIDQRLVERHGRVWTTGGLFAAPHRGLVEVTGVDRAEWLHNLVTNVVRNLRPGEGNYAFATTAQGRTMFDLNVLMLDERLWLDIDSRWLESALAHLNKYVVTENVFLADISQEWGRMDVVGPATPRLMELLGFGSTFGALADLQHVEGKFENHPLRVVRDHLGSFCRADIFMPRAIEIALSARLGEAAEALGFVRGDDTLFEMVRIESGVPASVEDIDDQVIPPETLQIERGICYVKGCYLGQEVLERMRSRGSMARCLVGLGVSGDTLPPRNAPVVAGEQTVGRVTSACHSVALGGILALGYVKPMLMSSEAEATVAIDDSRRVPVEVVDLPLKPSAG
jgi:folate-binding protein YgfZ